MIESNKSLSLRKMWTLCHDYLLDESKALITRESLEKQLELWTHDNPLKQTLASAIRDKSYEEKICFLFKEIQTIDSLSLPNIEGSVTTEDSLSPNGAPSPLKFYLENIRSALNVGSIFRLADSFHISEIYLGGYTPTPKNKKVLKTALGSETWMPWVEEPKGASFSNLRKMGYSLVGLETSSVASQLDHFVFPEKSVIIVGNERSGITSETLYQLDHIVAIPMYGRKNSLNVATALSLATYEWNKQWRK